MTSVLSYYAQRNNNVVSLAPVGRNTSATDFISLTIDPLYSSTIAVDVRGVTPFAGTRNYLLFTLSYDPTLAVNYPGLEFTVFFDSYGSSSLNTVTVAVRTPDQTDPIESLYPFNALSTAKVSVLSVTLKSNGRIFSIIGGGPGYWS